MGDLISFLAHQGIVRVLFVPTLMVIILSILWTLAAPRDRDEEDERHAQKS